jgi:phospholipase C
MSDDEPGAQVSRRGLLKAAGALGVLGATGLAGPLSSRAAAASARPSAAASGLPVKHVIICAEENRSFDHYFGFAPWVGRYGVPPGWTQPDGHGGVVAPYHFTAFSTPDVPHDWASMHAEWDGWRMDGFFTTGGRDTLVYYDQRDLSYYYSLFGQNTLCVNYFCSVMGPTYPNRLYLMAATSGGLTNNNLTTVGQLDYPIILDLLDFAGITWKIYNIKFESIPSGWSDNVAQFFARWARDPRLLATRQDYFSDLSDGTLPQVSWIIPDDRLGWDEHPPADIRVGMRLQRELITGLQQSRYWQQSAYLLTYDESGGFFDHEPPPGLDAYGAGPRVPTWVISPHAKAAHLEPTLYDHSSTLKFVEAVFGLPTLASINHQFDVSTPGANNDAAGGAPTGPPAPPRDRLTSIGDLTECFRR